MQCSILCSLSFNSSVFAPSFSQCSKHVFSSSSLFDSSCAISYLSLDVPDIPNTFILLVFLFPRFFASFIVSFCICLNLASVFASIFSVFISSLSENSFFTILYCYSKEP